MRSGTVAHRGLAAVGIAASIALAALVYAVATQAQPLVGLAVPAVLLVALVCARRPAAVIAAVLFLCASFGSLQAFDVVNPGTLVDLLLAGLLVSVIGSHALKERPSPWVLWPGVALVCLYVAVAFFEIPTAASVDIGVRSFRFSEWYMLALPLLALAGWSLATYLRIARAIVAVALIIGGYAVLRLLIGPAAREAEFALQGAGTYNVVDNNLALLGSFPARHSLAFWSACSAPFCVGVALTQTWRWRLVATAAAILCVIAVFGTEVRAALPALVAGIAVVLLLAQISAGRRAGPLGRTVIVTIVAFSLGAALFSMVVGEDSSRYSAIFSPSGDTSYEHRITKWQQAIDDIDHAPFGKGLGTAGLVQELGQGPFITEGSYGIDSSYLKIAYEQGFGVLALFIGTMLVLLAGLVRRAIGTADDEVRGIGMGAVGALTAALAMFVTGQYIENLPALSLWIMVGTGIGAISAARSRGTEQELSSAS